MKKNIISSLVLCSVLSSSMTALAIHTTTNSTTSTNPLTIAQPVDFTSAAEKATNAVVYIKVASTKTQRQEQYTSPFDDFFGDFFGIPRQQQRQQLPQTPRITGSGSGVILSSDGYIVTNNHVVKDADEITVILNDNREFKARIIGLDANSDLALLKIEAKNLPNIVIGSSENLKVGEWVLAVGNPYGLTSTVTAGIVSAKARSQGANPVESFIQTDAAINPGNSGGALVNSAGELVGINAMIYSQTGAYSGYGFAIPTTIMNKVVDDLKKYGTVQRALIGIQGSDLSTYIDSEKNKGKDVDLGVLAGVYIAEISPDGAAAQAGLEKGDIITAIDGKRIEKFGELQEAIAKHRPGDKIKVNYYRNKREQIVSLTLRNAQGTTSTLENIDINNLGVALRPLNTQEKQELSITDGVLVTNITRGKLQEAGITKGLIITKINDTPINSVENFEEAVKAANMSKERVLWIRAKTQSGLNRSFTIELSSKKNSSGIKNKSSKGS